MPKEVDLNGRGTSREHPALDGQATSWALLRFREGMEVNRKAVYRVLELKG